MPRPRPLPPDLPQRFSVRGALEIGVRRDRLRRSDLTAPFHGVRAPADTPVTTLTERCLQYAPRLQPGQFFSHETVFALRGLATPAWPYVPRIHVSACRPAREPRTAGVIGHRLQTRESATEVGEYGLVLEHPVRAWRQCGTLWQLEDLVAAADALLSGDHPLADVADLQHEIEEMGDVRGRILGRALAFARVGVRSPRETRLRLRLIGAGLPEPEVAWNVFDHRGTFVAELDLAYPRWRVAPEYDGRVHAENERQFARDADRWAAIRAEGWDHVRILNHHMRGNGSRAVALVREALLRAGRRPDLS